MRAGIETNRNLLADEPKHLGLPPARVGRRTGYSMEAEERSPSGQHVASTSYLVSIFRSAWWAQWAYNYCWDSWFEENFYTSPAPMGHKLGDHGAQALFQTFYPDPYQAELFFRRGAILVEVLQSIDTGTPSLSEKQSFYAIATKLSSLAHEHPRGL